MVAAGNSRPNLCEISANNRSADPTLPPVRKKLSSIPMEDRFSTDSQISVSISTIAGGRCKLTLQFDSLGLWKAIDDGRTPVLMIRVVNSDTKSEGLASYD